MNSSTADTPSPNDSDSTLEVEILPTSNGNSDVQMAKPVVPDTGYIPLQDFMGISNPDDSQKDKLQFIWNYYQKGRDRADTIVEIKETMHRLGQPPMGEDHLNRLYSYTRLRNESRSINKEIKAYESTD